MDRFIMAYVMNFSRTIVKQIESLIFVFLLQYFDMAWKALDDINMGLEKGQVDNDGVYKVDWGNNIKNTGRICWDQGAALVSSLGTLYIMEFTKEYQRARDWVQSKFSLISLQVFI